VLTVQGFLLYFYNMIVTAEKTNQEEVPPYNWLQGCCKNMPGGSVDDFLARSRADKELEPIERQGHIPSLWIRP